MLEIDKFLTATPADLEGLSWYEIVSRLGLLSFNSQGTKPIELIAKNAGIGQASTVLMVGCGAGGTAVHLAEMTGATVTGIDLSPESIKTATDLASKSQASERLHFNTGDANALSFAPDSFDLAITEYMAFFLKPGAFEGFYSALKPGGQIALAELMKDPIAPARADSKILAAEKIYSDLLGYRFHIPLMTEYTEWLTRAGFENVHVEKRFSEPSFHEKIENAGGWKNILRISKATLILMRRSPELRKKMIQGGRVKRTFSDSRPTAKYLYQALLMGRKPA